VHFTKLVKLCLGQCDYLTPKFLILFPVLIQIILITSPVSNVAFCFQFYFFFAIAFFSFLRDLCTCGCFTSVFLFGFNLLVYAIVTTDTFLVFVDFH
jgi:hypothetical protein